MPEAVEGYSKYLRSQAPATGIAPAAQLQEQWWQSCHHASRNLEFGAGRKPQMLLLIVCPIVQPVVSAQLLLLCIGMNQGGVSPEDPACVPRELHVSISWHQGTT